MGKTIFLLYSQGLSTKFDEFTVFLESRGRSPSILELQSATQKMVTLMKAGFDGGS